MASKQEIIDIYDENGIFTGRTCDRNTPLKKGEYMMYVLALLEDEEDGTFLITQRALDKKWAAGAWEIPGGGSASGETSLEAIRREVREETGLDVSVCNEGQNTPIYRYFNEDLKRGDNYFVDIYHFILPINDENITIEKSESINYKFAEIEDIDALNENNEFLHYSRLIEALENEKHSGL